MIPRPAPRSARALFIASTLTGEEAFAETLSWDEIRELLD
jgi:hypothetical protein